MRRKRAIESARLKERGRYEEERWTERDIATERDREKK